MSDIAVSEAFWRDSSVDTNSLDTEGIAYQLQAGYRLQRHLALEAAYMGFGDTEFTGDSNGINSIWNDGRVVGRTKVSGLSFAGVALWPGGDARLQLYAKGGMLFWDSSARYDSTINDINSINDDGVSPMVAAGLQWRVWRGWRVRAEWLYSQVTIANRDKPDVNFISLGLMHFVY